MATRPIIIMRYSDLKNIEELLKLDEILVSIE